MPKLQLIWRRTVATSSGRWSYRSVLPANILTLHIFCIRACYALCWTLLLPTRMIVWRQVSPLSTLLLSCFKIVSSTLKSMFIASLLCSHSIILWLCFGSVNSQPVPPHVWKSVFLAPSDMTCCEKKWLSLEKVIEVNREFNRSPEHSNCPAMC